MESHHRTNVSNVLVIGMGCAGLRAAIAAHMAGCEVTIVGKRTWKDAHTVLAAGGTIARGAFRDAASERRTGCRACRYPGGRGP